MMKTLYDLLDVRPDADAETLKKAFRKAVKAHHPDLHVGDPDAPLRFRQIAAANAVLRDANRRAAYDRLLALDRLPELERQQLRSKRMRTIVDCTLTAAVVSVALVGGYALFAPIPSTVVVAVKAHNDAAHGPPDMATAQPAARSNTTGRDGSRDTHEGMPDGEIATSAAAPEPNSGGSNDGPALVILSNDAKSHRERGIVSYRSGDLRRAIADLDQAIRLDPNDAQAYHIRGNAWDDIGGSDRALADYDQAIRIDPNNPAVFLDRGLLWQRTGALDRALVDLDRAIRFSFSDASIYGERGLVWYEKGRYDRALADFKKAIQIDPNFAVAYGNRGIILHRKGEFNRVFAGIDQATRADPNLLDVIRRASSRP